MKQLGGMITALVTSFSNDGKLDLDAMRKLVRFQVESGAAGLCPLGGTGEPLSMTVEEHKRVIDVVTEEAAGRIPVVVGCLLGNQNDILECGRHARRAGADAIMVIPPYFIVPKPLHIRRHFDAIAEKVDMPMVLFHSPSRSGVRLDVDFTLELINAIPRFVAIKDASGDLTFLAELQKSAPPEFRVLQGLDELLLPSFALGSPGAVISLGNLFPRMLRRMEQAYVSGDLDTAREIQFNLLPACRAIYGEPNPGPLKRALAMAGRSAGPTREPIYEPSGATVQALEELMPALCKAEAGVYDG